jgi:trehalose 6-phosphate phosphatase
VRRLNTTAGRNGWQALAASGRSVLIALDFDGTLAPIVIDPRAARPDPAVIAPLRRLLEDVETVVVLTGRPAGLAAQLLGADADETLSRLVVLGQYGLERWTRVGGTVSAVDDAARASVGAVRALLPDVLAGIPAPYGVLIEDKSVALAVHVRRTADPVAALELLRVPLARVADEHGLRLEPGRLVLELRPAGIDKGIALAELARASAPGAVVYVGDDLGDLAAFDAVDRLRASGVPGLLVCSGSDEVAELAARADLVVSGPAAVGRLLGEIADWIETAGRS